MNLRKEGYKLVEKRIADIIGEEYKDWGKTISWNENDVIYIDAQTGSGKSYFICHCLLEYAIAKQRRILYLVNRKVLQEQIQNEVDDAIEKISEKNSMLYSPAFFITVISYQTLEDMVERNGALWVAEYLGQYAYLVADEIHYMLQDATYNTNTILSFEIIMGQIGLVRIFMSATMKEIKGIIENKRQEIHMAQHGTYLPLREAKEYSMEQNYEHIQLKFFTDFVSLASIIEQDIKKWLIVVDTIAKGKKLLKELEKRAIDTVFIDAEYEKDSVSYETVRSVVDEKKFDSRILISTIILDNGLTIKDEELRNLVIIADTEIEFKQILGRKRLLDNEENVTLYIMRREKSDFTHRLRLVENHLNFINEHERYLQRQMNLNPYGMNITYDFAQLRNKSNKYLITSILKNERAYQCARHVMYYLNGDLGINPLARMQYIMLKKNYENILERFEKEGNDAFFKCQAKWLGIDNIDSELEEYRHSQVDKRRAEIISEIENIVNISMNNTEYISNREKFRKNLYDLFLEFVEIHDPEKKKSRYVSIIKDLNSNDRATSKDNFDYVMKCLAFPYYLQLQHTKPEKYTICRQEESEE